MTIEKGRPWGTEVDRPEDLRVVDSDHELAAALSDGSGTPTTPRRGDLLRTLGSRPAGESERMLALPVDLVDVTLDGGRRAVAAAHVIARSPWWRGWWWRGPVLVVMNAEFVGTWNLAPRGHPNDGRVETQFASAALRIRDRWTARARLGDGTHVPHPEITTRSVRSASWSFDRRLHIAIDGRYVGRSRTIAIDVIADAGILYS